jgi:predicted ATPase
MITELLLQNFKAFEKENFELGTLNLLSGLNNTGKSSVIQSQERIKP